MITNKSPTFFNPRHFTLDPRHFTLDPRQKPTLDTAMSVTNSN